MRKIWVLGITLVIALTLAAPVMAEGGTTHVVQAGENLYRIALRYGTTVQALAAANGIANPNRVYAGQRLVIPGSSGGSSGGGSASGQTYIVQRGDTLSSIAARHGITTQALAAANGITNPNRIYVGQRLVISGGSGSQPSQGSSGGSGRWIDIDLSAQTATAYEGNTAVRSTLVSTGLAQYPTPVGQFRIYVKYRYADMSGPGYYLRNVPYVMYFYRGYGLHGTYWHSNFGRPMSHGCINLPTSEAEWFYGYAAVGTLVNIHY